MSAKHFRVAFSFAAENREFVAKVANILAKQFGEESILYDEFHEAEFARNDLGIYLPSLYTDKSDLVAVIICPDYDNQEWTGLQWIAIHDLLQQRKHEKVLLSRFENAVVSGLSQGAGFIELDGKTPDDFVNLILERLALNEGRSKDFYKSIENYSQEKPTQEGSTPRSKKEIKIDSVISASNEHAEKQLLWSGVSLKLFSSIGQKVRLLESPFHGEDELNPAEDDQSDSKDHEYIYSLYDFIYNFFYCKWGDDDLGWASQVSKCKSKVDCPPILFLTGDAGIGKTASLKLLASQWQEQTKEKRILFVYTKLTDVLGSRAKTGAVSGFLGFLDAYMYSKHEGLTISQFMNSTDSRFDSIILILDAFDEASLEDGTSRLGILNGIVKYVDNYLRISHTNKGFKFNGSKRHKLRGIIIASRQGLEHPERRILRNPTVVSLEEFSRDNIENWLGIFNSNARVWDGDDYVEPLRQLQASDFISGEYKMLRQVVSTPLYLYLFACTLAVDESANTEWVSKVSVSSNDRNETPLMPFREATFQILDSFFECVRKNQFHDAQAFNSHISQPLDEKTIVLDKVFESKNLFKGRQALLSSLVMVAGQSSSREIAFDRDIVLKLDRRGNDNSRNKDEENSSHSLNKETVRQWAIRSLPLEPVDEVVGLEFSDSWRFPHLSLVDFILAEWIVDRLGVLKDVKDPSTSESVADWWINSNGEFRNATIETGRLIISDRAFDYLEYKLILLWSNDDKTNLVNYRSKVEAIKQVAKVWHLLDAAIIPSQSLTDNSNPNIHDGYVVAARKDDIGLRIANFGLPLLLSCYRAQGQDFEIGEDAKTGDNSRHRLRQYLRLSSYVLDSEFANRGDVNRLPLTKLKSRASSMEGIDMKDIILGYGELIGSELQHAYLLNANLRGITIHSDCSLQDANLVAANLRDAELKEGLYIDGVSFYKANFNNALIKNVTFLKCNLLEARLQNACLCHTVIDYCSMVGAKLKDANLIGATLKDTILIDAELENANLSCAKIIGGVWMNNINLEKATVNGAMFFKPMPLGLTPEMIDDLESRGAKVRLEVVENDESLLCTETDEKGCHSLLSSEKLRLCPCERKRREKQR